LLLRSGNAPDIPLARLQAGFEDGLLEGRPWRTFTLRDLHGEWYQSGEDYAIRQELAREIAIGVMLPWLLVLPAMALAVWLIVGVGFRSLQRVADQVRNRDSRQLGPIDIAQVPQEIQGLVVAVNGLLGRLDRALDGERSFTADAAHELRTPLAALRLHAENLAGARDEVERERSLADLRLSVERSQHLIDQLLALARLDPVAVNERELLSLDLAALLAKVMADLNGQADARRIGLLLDRVAAAAEPFDRARHGPWVGCRNTAAQPAHKSGPIGAAHQREPASHPRGRDARDNDGIGVGPRVFGRVANERTEQCDDARVRFGRASRRSAGPAEPFQVPACATGNTFSDAALAFDPRVEREQRGSRARRRDRMDVNLLVRRAGTGDASHTLREPRRCPR
jgi:hypothetical protein